MTLSKLDKVNKKKIDNSIMVCMDIYGNIWKTPIFGNPSKEEKFKQELAFRKYIHYQSL